MCVCVDEKRRSDSDLEVKSIWGLEKYCWCFSRYYSSIFVVIIIFIVLKGLWRVLVMCKKDNKMMLMQNEETQMEKFCVPFFLGKNHSGINYFLYNFCLKAIDRKIRTHTHKTYRRSGYNNWGIKRNTIIMSTECQIHNFNRLYFVFYPRFCC